MNTVHIKLAAVSTTLAQIVPEYDSSKVVLSEENRINITKIGLVTLAAFAVIFIVFMLTKRHRKKRRFVDR